MRRGCLTDDEIAARLHQPPGDAVGDDEVAAHIDACASCQRVVAEAARALAGGGASALRTLVDGERVGGRYVVRRFVGAGGMGEVYEALDETLSEPVALKTLGVALLDDGAAERRLKSEVQLARKVTHPNVCRIFDFGVHTRVTRGHGEAIPFFTMELLVGESLARRIERTKGVAVEEALPIALQIADGLDAVHRAGVLHRDLKPDNVFLVGSGPRVVLMDFGLAKAWSASVRHSISGQIVGTAGYMSPEQVEGKPASVGSDVYAFGVVLHELLVGKLPFAGSTPMALAADRLRRPPVPLREHDPRVPPAWERFVLRCLARDPDERFPDVTSLRAALLALDPAATPSRRPRRWALAAAAAVVVTVGALAASRRHAPIPPRSTVAAAAPQTVTRPSPAQVAPVVPAAPVEALPPPPARRRTSPTRRVGRRPAPSQPVPDATAAPAPAALVPAPASPAPVTSTPERRAPHPDAPFNPFERR